MNSDTKTFTYPNYSVLIHPQNAEKQRSLNFLFNFLLKYKSIFKISLFSPASFLKKLFEYMTK